MPVASWDQVRSAKLIEKRKPKQGHSQLLCSESPGGCRPTSGSPPAPRCHPAAHPYGTWQERCPQCPACQGHWPSTGLVLVVPGPTPGLHTLAAPHCNSRLVTLWGPVPQQCHHCPFTHAASAQQSMGPCHCPLLWNGGDPEPRRKSPAPCPSQGCTLRCPAPPLPCLLLRFWAPHGAAQPGPRASIGRGCSEQDSLGGAR